MLDTQQQQQDALTQQLSGRRLRGLSWNKTHEAWRVRIYFHGKLRFVGRFEDAVVAAKHYDKAAMYLYGDNAITNFGLEACKADGSTPVGACIIQAKQEAEEAAAKQQAGHLQQEQHQRAMMHHHHHHHHLKQGRNMLLRVQGDSKVSQQLHLNIAGPSDGLSPLLQQRLPHAAAFTITEQQQQQQGSFSFDQQQQQQQQSFSFDPQLHQLQCQLDLQGLQNHKQQQLLLQLQQHPLLWQGSPAIAPGYGADVGATSAPVTPVASAVVAAAAAAGNNLGFCSKQQYVLAHHHQQLTEQQQGALPLVNGDACHGLSAVAMSCCLPDVQPQQLLPTVFPALAGQAAHPTPPAGGSLQQGLSVSEQQLTRLRQQQLQLQQQQRDAEELLRQLKSLALQDITGSNSSTSSHKCSPSSPSSQILQMVAAENSLLTISGPQQQRLPPQQLSFIQIPGNSRLCPGMATPENPAGAAAGVAAMAAAAAAVGHSTSATASGCLSPVTPPLLGAASHWLTMNRLLQGSGDYAESVASMASSGVLEHLAAAGL